MIFPNKYRAKCFRCGKWVEAGEGHFSYEDFPGLRWPEARGRRGLALTEHVECKQKFAGTDVHYVMRPHNETAE